MTFVEGKRPTHSEIIRKMEEDLNEAEQNNDKKLQNAGILTRSFYNLRADVISRLDTMHKNSKKAT